MQKANMRISMFTFNRQPRSLRDKDKDGPSTFRYEVLPSA